MVKQCHKDNQKIMGHRFQLIPQLLRFGTTKVELKFTKYFLTRPN
jgi:hypothetical protein